MGETLLPRLQAAIYRYGMIKPGDRVAVGVSGGKDSLALLSLLASFHEFSAHPFPGLLSVLNSFLSHLLGIFLQHDSHTQPQAVLPPS